jgi:hypothetical protein
MSDVQANKLSALWFVMFSVDSQLPHFNLQSIPQRLINTKQSVATNEGKIIPVVYVLYFNQKSTEFTHNLTGMQKDDYFSIGSTVKILFVAHNIVTCETRHNNPVNKIIGACPCV